MKNLLIIIFSIAIFSSCEKKGCTNGYADNYSSDAKKDDGSCEFSSINSIIGKPWYRITDDTLYSFTLNEDGSWTTKRNCNEISEGTWSIDPESSKLFHTFNGIQEEYSIIEPTSNSVKFRGLTNGNADIAANDVLLVYNTSPDVDVSSSLTGNVNYTGTLTFNLVNDPSATCDINSSELSWGNVDNFALSESTPVNSVCGIWDISALHLNDDYHSGCNSGWGISTFTLDPNYDESTITNTNDGFIISGAINWDYTDNSVIPTPNYYKGSLTWEITIVAE